MKGVCDWKAYELLSVALVTRNRPGSLQRALASLRSQNIQPFEAIVSDDPDEEFVSEAALVVPDSLACVSRAVPNSA